MTTTRISAAITELHTERMRRYEDRKEDRKTDSAGRSQVSGQQETDSLSLSADAELLRNAEAIAASTPDIDIDKVEEIRQAIVRGELKIDYESLARKMLSFEASLVDIPSGDE